MKEVYIVSAARTPIGSFGGTLAKITAPKLGAIAIKGALEKAGISPEQVQEVLMGNVISANLGQAPAKQAAIYAGLGNEIPCTAINKVCSSGVKSVMFAAQSIMAGMNDIVIAGGMENMSSIPYYVPNARYGYKFGDASFVDGLVRDGLQDVYDQRMMGECADATAEKYAISRAEQDAFAIQSYQRSASTTAAGKFKSEIIPVEIPQRKGEAIIMSEDEEFKSVKFEKIPKLRPAFTKTGTVTAANASTINDGAAAIVLASKEKVQELGLKPIAKIISFADASHEPKWFTTAPTKAAPKALKLAGMTKNDIDFFEVNEAFSVVTLAFNKVLDIDSSKVNVYGGSVALGHPLGASGTRILTTLTSVLRQEDGGVGCVAICNGGGGASSIIIERV